jgi:hypothetical protein
VIYWALRKYYTPMYDDLIKKIETGVSNLGETDVGFLRWIEESPWNY